jgi:23S rRNA pseudouridine1911/1915/1917 synthase
MDILYEDNHVIVVYKEKGILSQADGSNKPDMLTIIKNYIKEKYNKSGNVYLGLVHRLDINTSGVMVFAKTSKAASRLSEDIKNNKLHKRYYCVVEGNITNGGKLIDYLEKDEIIKKAFISKNGKEAILEYNVIKNYKIDNNDVTLLEINLITGRFHQIRCQLSNIGHPLYGDKKYGSKYSIEYLDFPLEAYHLEFIHPTTKELLVFEKSYMI